MARLAASDLAGAGDGHSSSNRCNSSTQLLPTASSSDNGTAAAITAAAKGSSTYNSLASYGATDCDTVGSGTVRASPIPNANDSTADSADGPDLDDNGDESDDTIDTADTAIIPTQAMASHRSLLVVAYAGLLLLSFTTSLEGQVTGPLAAYAVSSFDKHALLSTVFVVQGVVNAVIKPPMAKMAEVFGRLGSFTASVLFCVIGYVQMAAAQNVRVFASAQILYSAGVTGLQVLQQILVADTSDLRHRALLSALPDTPFLVTIWIGPSISAAILDKHSWRWGYAMWALILPVAFAPLAVSLFLNTYQVHKRQRHGRRGRGRDSGSSISSSSSTFKPTSSWLAFCHGAAENVWQLLVDLDAVGILLLSAALALILLPLSLSSSSLGGWSNPAIPGSIVVGLLLLVFAFPAWEARPDLAPHPLIPPALLRSRTFCAGCGIPFFFFAVFYLSVQPYFYSYLQVAHNQSVTSAGRITQIFSFASTVSAVLASLAIRHFRRYKAFVVAGAAVFLLGIALMLRYRTADAGTLRLVATQLFVGHGAGLMSVPTQIGIQASVSAAGGSPELVGAATAVYLTMGEAGGAVGAAISGAVWSRLMPAKLDAYLPESARANAPAIFARLSTALSYPWGSPERDAINRAYQETLTAMLYLALLLCVPVLVLSLLMRDYRLDGGGSKPAVGALGSGEDDRDDADEGDDAEAGTALLADSRSNTAASASDAASPASASSSASTAPTAPKAPGKDKAVGVYTVNEFVGTAAVGERVVVVP